MKLVGNIPADNEKLKWLGGFNDPPPNWKEITEEQLVRNTMFNRFNPEYIEYKQIWQDGKFVMSVTLYIYQDGKGIGLSTDNWQVRWFEFARCNHDYETVNIGNCLNRYTCSKCGYSEDVDSSD